MGFQDEVRRVDVQGSDPAGDVGVMAADDLEPETAQYFAHIRRGGDRGLKNLSGPPGPFAFEVCGVHPEPLHPLAHIPPRRAPRIHPQLPQRLRQRS
jgi:hypothetical protein